MQLVVIFIATEMFLDHVNTEYWIHTATNRGQHIQFDQFRAYFAEINLFQKNWQMLFYWIYFICSHIKNKQAEMKG